MAQQLQNQRPSLDDFVADLTEAAYPIALRHKGASGGSTWNWTFGERWLKRSRSGNSAIICPPS